jgi:hypothetical protein
MSELDLPCRDRSAAWRRAFFWLFVVVLASPFFGFAVLCLLEALGIPASHMNFDGVIVAGPSKIKWDDPIGR